MLSLSTGPCREQMVSISKGADFVNNELTCKPYFPTIPM